MRPIVGVVGALGERPVGPFLEQLATELAQSFRDRPSWEAAPAAVVAWPWPRPAGRRLSSPELREALLAAVRRLTDAGASVLCAPSHTLHLHHEALAREAGVPVVHMVDEALRALPAGAQRIAVLAARPIAEALLYPRRAEALGLRIVDISVLQADLDALMASALASDAVDSLARWEVLGDKLVALGADAIIVASSPLRSVAQKSPIPLIDAHQNLARVAASKLRALLAT